MTLRVLLRFVELVLRSQVVLEVNRLYLLRVFWHNVDRVRVPRQ